MKSVHTRDETRRPMESAAAERPPQRCKDQTQTHAADRAGEVSPTPLLETVTATAETSAEAVTMRRRLAQLLAKARSRSRDPYQYLLVLRFALLNLVGFALLGAAYIQGLVDMAIAADRTYLSVVIFFVFVAGLAMCGRRVWQTSRELNVVRACDTQADAVHELAPLLVRKPDNHRNIIGALRLRLAHRIAIVRHIANSLVIFGLIGTVLGFIIALSGVDPEHASDISAIGPMVSTLISGMSIALYTTLIGAILNVWLMANHQLLAGGTVKLIAAIMELTEEHARN
ncbi:MAG: MotA/TolQ/ExbB proton channel family protein [Acidiferrobacterales bacterium]|nr:MotA/TolQ/ExbB proton channel family protein [Gammaproteobacteria bacterium]